MVFSSTIFLGFFLPILLMAYLAAPSGRRNAVLLLGSLLFYSWGEPRAILLMLALIVANYFLGRAIGYSVERGKASAASAWLALGVAIDIGALAAFKYLSFLILSANNILGARLPDPKIALPIGISFYLFQIVSYLVDVRRREVAPEKSLASFALYVSLFPQLIAGPIVRYKTIASEMRDRAVSFDNVFSGLQRFVCGLAKKVLIADTLAQVADLAFSTKLDSLPQSFAWAGIICYALQIFFDFSGYSDMAIGLGRVFNFRFLENFDHPYCACSVREFWRRWHISLSTWFRDYLYIPMGGSRVAPWRTYLNQITVFFLCGLWHGADWAFVAWGLYHGLGLTFEKFLSRTSLPGRVRLPRVLRNLYVWLFVIVGWVFFAAGMHNSSPGDPFASINFALGYLKIMFAGSSAQLVRYWPAVSMFNYFIPLMAAIGMALSYPRAGEALAKLRDRDSGVALTIMLFVIAYSFAMTSGYSPFIYFRF